MNFGAVFLDSARITLGDNILMGPNVQLYTDSHPTDPQLRLDLKEMAYPITIGNNGWMGGCVIVCPGVTIGDDTVIGAGSVVTKVSQLPRLSRVVQECEVERGRGAVIGVGGSDFKQQILAQLHELHFLEIKRNSCEFHDHHQYWSF